MRCDFANPAKNSHLGGLIIHTSSVNAGFWVSHLKSEMHTRGLGGGALGRRPRSSRGEWGDRVAAQEAAGTMVDRGWGGGQARAPKAGADCGGKWGLDFGVLRRFASQSTGKGISLEWCQGNLSTRTRGRPIISHIGRLAGLAIQHRLPRNRAGQQTGALRRGTFIGE